MRRGVAWAVALLTVTLMAGCSDSDGLVDPVSEFNASKEVSRAAPSAQASIGAGQLRPDVMVRNGRLSALTLRDTRGRPLVVMQGGVVMVRDARGRMAQVEREAFTDAVSAVVQGLCRDNAECLTHMRVWMGDFIADGNLQTTKSASVPLDANCSDSQYNIGTMNSEAPAEEGGCFWEGVHLAAVSVAYGGATGFCLTGGIAVGAGCLALDYMIMDPLLHEALDDYQRCHCERGKEWACEAFDDRHPDHGGAL